MKKTLTIIGLAVATLAGAQAQVLYTGNYSQNFNSIGNGTVSWTDNSTLLGWSVTAEASQTSFNSSNGSTATGAVYNFGTTGGADRSLGYVGSGSNEWTNFYLQLQNNTGSTLTSLSVSYDGRLWRSGGAQPGNSTNTFAFYHATGTPTLFDSNATTGWTASSGLNYAPTVAVAAGFLSGASTTISGNLTGLSVANGSSIYLRWLGQDGTGFDAGIAIDNVTVVPEPATWALIALGSAFMLWNLRRKRSIKA